MLLRRLLDDPVHRLEMIYDPGHSRDMVVERVFVTDQARPERYLSGGELVLTGLLFHSGDPRESEAFVASASAGGAVVIGAGVDHFGEIPDHLIAACRAHRMPLFSVPADVSFADMIDEFISHSADKTHRLRAALDQSRRLLSSLAAGRELDDLAATVVGATKIGCQILTSTGRRVCAVGPGLTEPQVDQILAAARAGRQFPLAASNRTVLRVGPVRDPLRSWYLIVDSPPSHLTVDDLDAFTEFAAVAALVHARDSDAQMLRDRHDDLDVAAMGTGPVSHGPGTVLAIACDDPGRVRAVVRDVLTTVTANATVGVYDGEVIAYAPGRSTRAVVEAVSLHLRRVLHLLGGRLAVGHCTVTGSSSLSGAVRGARQAAQLGDDGLTVTSADSLGTAAALFAHLPDEVRLDFVDRVLGQLARHDAATEAGLTDTLIQFLANDCSWVRTADAMHVHQNTVRYRVARAAEVSGRDLSDLRDRFDIHLALTLR